MPTASPLPHVAPLRGRTTPSVLVMATHPLSATSVAALVRATGASRSLLVGSGRVHLGAGRTTALAVDAGSFRAWTPRGTAESDPVWRSVAGGEGAVAHVVAKAFAVRLGGHVTAAAARPVDLRVGSFATTSLPAVGLVVASGRGSQLGLVPSSALLLATPGRDPEVSAALARDAHVPGVTVTAVELDRRASGRWTVPTVGRVTSPFGNRIHPITHLPQFHEGIDIGASLGAAVYAMSDGEVLYAGPASGFGTEVVLSHRGGVTTVYGHVSRLLVTGGHVFAGQPIALVGNEGESTGPHLHAEVRVGDTPVDPIAWLRAHGVRIKCSAPPACSPCPPVPWVCRP